MKKFLELHPNDLVLVQSNIHTVQEIIEYLDLGKFGNTIPNDIRKYIREKVKRIPMTKSIIFGKLNYDGCCLGIDVEGDYDSYSGEIHWDSKDGINIAIRVFNPMEMAEWGETHPIVLIIQKDDVKYTCKYVNIPYLDKVQDILRRFLGIECITKERMI